MMIPDAARLPVPPTLRWLVATALLGLALAILLWRRQALKLRLERSLRLAVSRHPGQRGTGDDDGEAGCVPAPQCRAPSS